MMYAKAVVRRECANYFDKYWEDYQVTQSQENSDLDVHREDKG
jgi:hypothetical protein